MGTYIHGTFKNRNNDTIEVEINSNVGNAEYVIGDNYNSPIKFSDDPVTIEAECDDMFTTIIKKICKISLVTNMYLGNVLFAANEKSVTCRVTKNNVCVFDGFVEPNTYSMGWAHQYEQFEINCIDYLGCISYEYLTDDSSYASLKQQDNVYSFKHYLQQILPENVYWDKSKLVGNVSAFDACGVALNVFLGDSEDDIMNNEEVLNEILQYLNLHIIQEGENLVIFDWNTIKESSTSLWYNVFDNSTITIPTYPVTINKDRYASNDTAISMSEVYNQIQVTCEFEKKDEVIKDPLDSSDVVPYVPVKQKFLREYISSGEGSSAQGAFKSIVKGGINGAIPYSDYDAWTCREWYFEWIYNPDWKLYYYTEDIENILEIDETTGKYINQWKILERLKNNYRLRPALLSIGKSSAELSSTVQKQNGSIPMNNYLVIAVNGRQIDDESEANQIDYENSYASGNFGGEPVGLMQFTKGESGTYSPSDDDTTNYLVIGGSMILNPIMPISGASEITYHYTEGGSALGSNNWHIETNIIRENQQNTTFQEVYDNVDTLSILNTVPVTNNGDGGFYAMQFYGSRDPYDEQTPMNSTNLIYPFVNEDKAKLFQYNYSLSTSSEEQTYSSTDLVDKIPILRCMLKIGDKYLNEIFSGNHDKTSYEWTTTPSTFTIGIDPNIGDYIIGKEWELANTVNGRISNERGTAIPIRKSDRLTGAVDFKIIGIENTWWNDIIRRHPTMFRHTKYYDNYKLLMTHISSIWIKEFNIKIISDNAYEDTATKSKDIVYISAEEHDYIKKKDDITFKINTMPTTAELNRLGITTNVSNSNVVNMTNSEPLASITDVTTNQTNRPEKLYIDQYWNLYNSPKVIIDSSLKDTNTYPFMNMYNFTMFSNMIPLKVNRNLKDNSITVTCRQI